MAAGPAWARPGRATAILEPMDLFQPWNPPTALLCADGVARLFPLSSAAKIQLKLPCCLAKIMRSTAIIDIPAARPG